MRTEMGAGSSTDTRGTLARDRFARIPPAGKRRIPPWEDGGGGRLAYGARAMPAPGYVHPVQPVSRRDRLIDVAICAVILLVGVPPTLESGELGAGTDLDTVALLALLPAVFLRRRHALGACVAFFA